MALPIEQYAGLLDVDNTIVGYDRNLRPGIIKLLEEFQNRGTRIILTTSGGGLRLETIFNETGIKRLITDFFVREQIDVGLGKQYGPALKKLGITPEQATHKVFVTGNELADQPADHPLVFILDPIGFRRDASHLDEIIHQLMLYGNGSFISGFRNIERNQRIPMSGPGMEEFPLGTMLSKDIRVALAYRNPTMGGTRLPRFTPGIIIPTLRVV